MKKAALEDKGIFNPKARFTVYYNGRCLIIRECFEEYLREHPEFIRRKRRDNDGK